MPSIKNIIFDYGNVIFNIDFLRTQEAFIKLGIPDATLFFSHQKHNSLFDDFEQGLISPAEFRNGIRKISGKHDLSDQEIDDAWNTLLIGVPQGNHELLLQLKSKYRTFLLSNNNAIHYEWIMNYLDKDFGLAGNDDFFEKAYYSHLMGMRKPNKDIFQFVMDKHNLIAEETLFIDDSPQHLKAAQELGLKTYLMQAPDTLQLLFSNGEMAVY
jgi:FMN phosphatase YigB (HAD superfamily)